MKAPAGRLDAALAGLRLAALFCLAKRAHWRVTAAQLAAALEGRDFAAAIARAEKSARRNRWMFWRRRAKAGAILERLRGQR